MLIGMSLDELPNILSDIVVIAVVWDEIEGPTIISKAPTDGLADPINIALQIYLSSVAVFGQHGETKRIDFSLPLLSISPNHLVIVAFDSWPDLEVRGDERPFFIGFIMDRDTQKIISEYLNNKIWTYMDLLKERKSAFDAQPIYDELVDNLNKKSIDTDISLEDDQDQNYTQIL